MVAYTLVEKSYNGGALRTSGYGAFAAGETGAMPWTLFEGTNVAVGLSGTATSVTAVIERSGRDPSGPSGASSAPADTTGLTGNLATGVPANIYEEPGVGWWRVNITASSGGTVLASLSGTAS